MKQRARRTLVVALIAIGVCGTATAGAVLARAVLRTSTPRTAVSISGKWTLVVRSPAGKLVSSRHFENSFVGGEDLVQLLEVGRSVGGWHVNLLSSGQSAFEDDDANVPSAAPSPTRNLVVSEQVEAGVHELVLQGSVTSAGAASVDEVMTTLVSCDATAARAQCAATGQATFAADTFTDTTLAPAIDVQTGDTVGITVKIGFTSVGGAAGAAGTTSAATTTAAPVATTTTTPAGPVSVTSSSVSGPVYVHTNETAGIVATLKDANGVPVAGVAVSAVRTAGAGSSSATATTDANGIATMAVHDSTVEHGSWLVSDTSDGLALGSWTVNFIAPSPPGSGGNGGGGFGCLAFERVERPTMMPEPPYGCL